MSNNNDTMIVFVSILGAILATGLLALNPSTITTAGAQLYEDDRYGYDNHPKKSSDVNAQKIKCINSNINVNGVDITQIPQDGLATTAANEAGAEGVNAQNGNGFGDKINFEKNLVNICVNVNANEQVKVSAPEQTCEGCFSDLDQDTITRFLSTFDQILNSLEIDAEIDTLADLCEFLQTSTEMSDPQKRATLDTALGSEGLSDETIENILQCLEDRRTITGPQP